jgi:hypothetical protein
VSLVEVELIEKVEDVASLIDDPFFLHWYVNGDVPLADTEKVAVLPAVTEAEAGWVVIVGAVIAAETVRVAAVLIAEPALLLKTTV